ISAVHSEASSFEATDWQEICLLYERLHELQPSPIIALNQSVARSFADGPAAGLAVLEQQEVLDALGNYQPYYVAKADMLSRSGNTQLAAEAYRRAMHLTENEVELAHLEARLAAFERDGA
ncbi:MAG: RNA polymerase sigma factor, partial [Rhizobiales bacterium]|nr:RNA polymerase sigma factor [Hyphomicrobiales bacterium]